MSDKKPKQSSKLAEREAKNKRDYERLVKKTEQALEHHSPGIWGWLTDKVDDAIDWGKDAIGSVNDWVDEYVWDTSEAEGKVEEAFKDGLDAITNWAKDPVENIPDEIDKGTDSLLDNTEEPLKDADDDINEGADEPEYEAKDDTPDVPPEINIWLDGVIPEIAGTIITGGGGLGMGAQAFFDSIIDIIPAWNASLTLNLDDFVDAGLKLYDVQKRLAQRILELEREGQQ